MADPVIGFDRSIDPDSSARDITALLNLATTNKASANEADAEQCVRDALVAAERTLGPDQPELTLVLTELTRRYLHRSAFASAEPLLLRLLEMKRTKGEDHPEVATVLASLATVRQSLGSHESAEQLLRRVLEIRERTLPPNHFAIATALEHLGDACAARGKIGDALTAFQRALSIRERTLGAAHPSLRVARERIADLQLQAEESLTPEAAFESGVAAERLRLLTGDPLLSQSEISPIDENLPAPPESVAPAAAGAAAAATATAEPIPYRQVLESLREELEKPYQASTFATRSRELLEMARPWARKKEVIGGVIVVAITLLSIAAGTNSGASTEANRVPAFFAAAATPRINPAPTLPAAHTRESAKLRASSASTVAKREPPRARPVEGRSTTTNRSPDKKTEQSAVSLPALARDVMSTLSSVAAKAAAETGRVGDPVLPETPNPLTTRRPTFDDTEQSAAPQRARLLGDLPRPRVPTQLADVEGEVRVRFSVDTNGQPMMSTLEVVNSPNPLLSEAVRKVIPTMRFEPARTGGANSRAVVDIVQVGFQFSRRE